MNDRFQIETREMRRTMDAVQPVARRIMIVAPKSPFPARSDGITVRLNPVLEYLASRHEVDLVSAADERRRATLRLAEAADVCRNAWAIELDRRSLWKRRWEFARSHAQSFRAPENSWHSYSGAVAKFVLERCRNEPYDVVLWFGGAMSDALGMFLKYQTKAVRIRAAVVIDWIDSPSLHLLRRLEHHGTESSLLGILQLRSARAWERKVNEAVAGSAYISSVDAAYASGRMAESTAVIPNGVIDDDIVEGEPAESVPASRTPVDSLTLGFLGNMGYEPNIAAALRLHDKIFKPLQMACPGLKLKIIGRVPDPRVLAIAGPDVEVTGAVQDIWLHIQSVDLFVFPMQIGAGLQNKVLEAMRAAKPTILSAICADPIGPDVNSAAVIAETDEQFIEAARQLIRDPSARRSFGRGARELAKRYSWTSILPEYERFVLSGRI